MSGTYANLVDVEALLVDWLLDGTETSTLVADGDGIATELPRGEGAAGSLPLPFLTISKLPGTFADPATGRLERARIEVQSWADTKADASDLAAAAIEDIAATAGADHAAGVVTGFEVEQSPWWNPDPETDLPRYVATVALWVRPFGSGS